MTTDIDPRLGDTRRAFDAVAAEYDGPTGNNELIQYMRAELIGTVTGVVPPGSRLLDLGCGTGIDAVRLGRQGYQVTAIDWSPEMVRATQRRVKREGLEHFVSVHEGGIHQLDARWGNGFDAIYSNLGPLNCVPDLQRAAVVIASLLRPGGRLVASVIGRDCPWEILYFGLRGKLSGARRRYSARAIPVPLEDGFIWTRYYFPGDFARELEPYFVQERYRSLCCLAPPPYLIGGFRRLGRVAPLLTRLDAEVGKLPVARDLGDHFLAIMRVNERYAAGGSDAPRR